MAYQFPSHVWFVTLLVVVAASGLIAAVEPPGAASDPPTTRPATRPAESEMEAIYALVRNHERGTRASGEVLKAADAAFDVCRLYGKTAEEIERLLGPPSGTGSVGERKIMTYYFIGERQSVVVALWFTPAGRLFGIEGLPTA